MIATFLISTKKRDFNCFSISDIHSFDSKTYFVKMTLHLLKPNLSKDFIQVSTFFNNLKFMLSTQLDLRFRKEPYPILVVG
jgi:hypothetical protein